MVTLKLVNTGRTDHELEVPDASSSCGRFRWHVSVRDSSGQYYQNFWESLAGHCGRVFIPAHTMKLPPGEVKAFTFDTSQPFYLIRPPSTGLSAMSRKEPRKLVLPPGDYRVEVRGGDIVAEAAFTLTP